jgi:hypothetical protein
MNVKNGNVGFDVGFVTLDKTARSWKGASKNANSTPAPTHNRTLSSGSCASTYSYSPLLGQNIRLLHLLPSTAGSAVISCEMITMPLSSAPEKEYCPSAKVSLHMKTTHTTYP